MADNEFEWFHDNRKTHDETNTRQKEEDLKQKIGNFIQNNRGIIFLTLFIFSLSLLSSGLAKDKKRDQTASRAEPIEVLMSMWPIKKGDPLPIQYLKVVTLNASSLTKTQRLQILEADTQFDPSTVLKAIKDIPPNKPIFWKHLQLKEKAEIKEFKLQRRIQYAR